MWVVVSCCSCLLALIVGYSCNVGRGQSTTLYAERVNHLLPGGAGNTLRYGSE